MNGPVWIASYFILMATVVGLFFAVAALYRSLARPGTAAKVYTWPLAGLDAGASLPSAVIQVFRDAGFESAGPTLLVASSVEVDGFAAFHAAQVAAEALSWQFVVIIRNGELLSDDLSAVVFPQGVVPVSMSDEAFRELGITHAPVFIYCRDGRVIDATPALVSPTEVIRFFRPVGSEDWRTASLAVANGGAQA